MQSPAAFLRGSLTFLQSCITEQVLNETRDSMLTQLRMLERLHFQLFYTLLSIISFLRIGRVVVWWISEVKWACILDMRKFSYERETLISDPHSTKWLRSWLQSKNDSPYSSLSTSNTFLQLQIEQPWLFSMEKLQLSKESKTAFQYQYLLIYRLE